MFSITGHKGFSMTFENRLTISVQFGRGNYCEHRFTVEEPQTKAIWSSQDAEVAIWSKHSKKEINELGWRKPDEVARLIAVVAAAKSIEDIVIGE